MFIMPVKKVDLRKKKKQQLPHVGLSNAVKMQNHPHHPYSK